MWAVALFVWAFNWTALFPWRLPTAGRAAGWWLAAQRAAGRGSFTWPFHVACAFHGVAAGFWELPEEGSGELPGPSEAGPPPGLLPFPFQCFRFDF